MRAPHPSAQRHLLTVPETAETLRVSERLVWRYLADGVLPRVRLGGATRIRQSDLNRLIQEGLATEEDRKR